MARQSRFYFIRSTQLPKLSLYYTLPRRLQVFNNLLYFVLVCFMWTGSLGCCSARAAAAAASDE